MWMWTNVLLAFVFCFATGSGDLLVSDSKLRWLVANCRWIYYPGPDINNVFAVGLENISQIINHSSFDPNRTTVVHVHGLNQSPIQLRVQIITEAYLYVGGHNIILLDWAIPASESYLQAVLNEIAIGKVCGAILVNAFETTRLKIEKVHLIGHSLGAHLVSGIGQVSMKLGWIFKRITGLDPAGPLHYFAYILLNGTHLNHADAVFVDCYITDLFVYGRAFSQCHVNVYVNGGIRYQPGCPLFTIPFTLTPEDTCSHHRSVEYWVEAVRLLIDGKPFMAIRALTWAGFLLGITQRNSIIEVGPNCSSDARGDYFLRTNRTSPFSLGMDGTHN